MVEAGDLVAAAEVADGGAEVPQGCPGAAGELGEVVLLEEGQAQVGVDDAAQSGVRAAGQEGPADFADRPAGGLAQAVGAVGGEVALLGGAYVVFGAEEGACLGGRLVEAVQSFEFRVADAVDGQDAPARGLGAGVPAVRTAAAAPSP